MERRDAVRTDHPEYGSSLAGRVALVTGAGRGLGRSIALTLAGRGARVMAVALEENELESLSQVDPSIHSMVGSVADADDRARVLSVMRTDMGPIDILVNNAGLSYGQLDQPKLPIWQASAEVWRSMMDVNLDAPFHLSREVVGEMIARNWGRIVMISSTAGQVGIRGMGSYCASKHGLIGLALAIAQDVAPFGVTCNAVAPGYMRTKASETSARLDAASSGVSVDEVWARRATMYPSQRILETQEVANVVAYLASDDASGVNGETIRVTMGGLV